MDDRAVLRKYTQPSSSSSPCPVRSRAPASCSARCCAQTLKSRTIPVRRSAAGLQKSHKSWEGGKVLTPLDRARTLVEVCWCFFSPANRNLTTSQVRVNQRNWANRVICACVKTQRRTNFCSSRQTDPSEPDNQRHLSVMYPPGVGILHNESSGSRVQWGQRVTWVFPGGSQDGDDHYVDLFTKAVPRNTPPHNNTSNSPAHYWDITVSLKCLRTKTCRWNNDNNM